VGLSVGITVGVDVGGCGVSVSVDVDVGERGVSLAGIGVLVGIKADLGEIDVAVGGAEVGSGVAADGTDTAVSSAVPQAASSNAQSKRLNGCRFMATPFSQRLLSVVWQCLPNSLVRRLGPSFPAAIDRPICSSVRITR